MIIETKDGGWCQQVSGVGVGKIFPSIIFDNSDI